MTRLEMPWRFRWDHRNSIHRTIVKAANRQLARLPLMPKYRLAHKLRNGRIPYSLVGPGDVVVQVGAPADTLESGRSRGMHLALRSRGGRAIIVEPDPESAAAFRRGANLLGLTHVRVANVGAWCEASVLTLRVDTTHPATNYVDGTVDYPVNRRDEFESIQIPVKTLDEIVMEEAGQDCPIRLVSITTNNSEREILRGMEAILSRGIQYISLARTGPGYDGLLEREGYVFLGHDDRGYTYVRRAS